MSGKITGEALTRDMIAKGFGFEEIALAVMQVMGDDHLTGWHEPTYTEENVEAIYDEAIRADYLHAMTG